MARENTVYLHGQIHNKPKLYVDKGGNNVQSAFSLKVMRRPFLTGEGQTSMGKIRVDFPVVLTRNDELIKQCVQFHEGDMVDVKGVITSRNVKKDTFCPNGHRVSAIGTYVFVTPIFLCQREQQLLEEDGAKLLSERCEISNNIMVLGSLCREPEFYEYDETTGSCVCQYQIAVNRRYHIKDAHDEERTDYLWVKTINRQAREDKEHLHVGSSVLINGSIQTRAIKRDIVCPICGETFTKEETVSELFPYAVEYLMGCYFPPKEVDESGG